MRRRVALHQLVHTALATSVFLAGAATANSRLIEAFLLLGASCWLTYRAHLYHHARTGVGDHD